MAGVIGSEKSEDEMGGEVEINFKLTNQRINELTNPARKTENFTLRALRKPLWTLREIQTMRNSDCERREKKLTANRHNRI